MLSPEEVYSIIIEKFPETNRTDLADFGDFYGFTPVLEDDMSDEYYKIDKETGEITEWDFAEFQSFISRLPEEPNIPIINVSETG